MKLLMILIVLAAWLAFPAAAAVRGANAPPPLVSRGGPFASPRGSDAGVPDGGGGTIVTWAEPRDGLTVAIRAQRIDAAGAVQWAAGGAPVCTTASAQYPHSVCTDGSGGVIIAWTDLRSDATPDVYAQRLDASGAVQWAAGGIALCSAASTTRRASAAIASDDSGGAIVVWADNRAGTYTHLYGQRVSATGEMLWDPNGAPVCTLMPGRQDSPVILPDGERGAFVTWLDQRAGGGAPYNNLYVQRLNAAGSIQWAAGGAPLCKAVNDQRDVIMAPFSGGAIVAWRDHRGSGWDLYAQRVDRTGVVGWLGHARADSDGVALCQSSGVFSAAALVPDGAGGAIAVWPDTRSGSTDVYAQHLDSEGRTGWSAGGVSLCAETGAQIEPAAMPDGLGGAIVAWADGRSGCPESPNESSDPFASAADIYAQRVDGSGAAQWTAGGVPVCALSRKQRSPALSTDGAGGAIVTWDDFRDGSGGPAEIFAQRLNGAGESTWHPKGILVHGSPGVQRNPVIADDGAGGTFVAWTERRDGEWDILARRFHADGTAPWPAVTVCAARDQQLYPVLVADGAGGAIVAWEDYRGGACPDVYAQRLNAAGAAQWASDGVPICTTEGAQGYLNAIPDGAGGAVLTWIAWDTQGWALDAQRVDADGAVQWAANGVRLRPPVPSDDPRIPWGISVMAAAGGGSAVVAWIDSRTGVDIHAQKLDADGTLLWAADGEPVCTAATVYFTPAITADGTGGALVAWTDSRSGSTSEIYAQRVSASGRAEWAADGVQLRGPVGGTCTSPAIEADGAGGAIVAWENYPDNGRDADLYGQRVNGAGSALWGTGGSPICAVTGSQSYPTLCADGAGGAVVAWTDQRLGNWDVFAQRVDSTGLRLWGPDGVAACSAAGDQCYPVIARDGSGGAFVAWQDARDPAGDIVRLTRIAGSGSIAPGWAEDGTTDTEASLVSAEAQPGLVRLVWHASDWPAAVTVQRRSPGADWVARATLVPDGTGRIEFEDRDVVAGTRYGYRLGFFANGAERIVAMAWVDVPAALAPALEGASPNPTAGDVLASIILPGKAPASLELVDLAGRLLLARDVGSLGAGRHVVPLVPGSRLASGVYLLRLKCAAKIVTTRVCVLR